MNSRYIPKIWTRKLPKTGQTTSYQSGDDGDIEAGWARGTRFVEKTIAGVAVILDYATGLMWPKDIVSDYGSPFDATMTWSNAITNCNNLVFAGFSDWRLPNVLEALSIKSFTAAGFQGGIASPFSSVFYYASTTVHIITTYAYVYKDDWAYIDVKVKTESHYALPVRSFI